MSFLSSLQGRARALDRAIALPEASDPRILEAAMRGAADGLFRPVLYGAVDPITDEVRGRSHPTTIHERISIESSAPGDELRSAVVALAEDRVDGVVAGAIHATADVLRMGLRELRTAREGVRVSSSFYMVPSEAVEDERVLTFTDAGVTPDPDAEALAVIAEQAVDARRRIVGDEPRVAFLSYSTKGSAAGPAVDRVRRAFEIFREARPDVCADGELQADAALDPEVADRKAPGSPLGGRANVLVFPDLDAANIGYKLVHRLAGGRALGPILQGLAKPLNDLSRGATSDEIVNIACITALLSAP